MKKKVIKVLIGLFVILFIWGAIFITNCVRVENLKNPICVIPAEDNDHMGPDIYYGMGYTIESVVKTSAEKGMHNYKSKLTFLGHVIVETEEKIG